MKRYLDKINKEGKYTEFPGITVIANTSPKDHDFWKSIHEVLDTPLVSNYFAPLPQESYHMTAMNLYTEMADGGEDWGKFVAKKLDAFKKLHTTLEENKIYPQIQLKSIRTLGVIQLQLEIPQEQRQAIEKIAAEFEIPPEKIPKEMHITLGYQYKMITGSDGDKLKGYLEEAIQRLFAEQPSLTLEAPMLSYFKSMEKFTSWDAKKNPFVSNRFNLLQFITGSKKENKEAEEDNQESRFTLK